MRFALASLALVAATTAAGAQAVTTRIETRPYYGAVTTIEHGVRVTRALPAHDRIIINPNGAAAVSINVGSGDSGGNSVVQQSTNHTTVNGRGPAYFGVPGSVVRRPHVQQGPKPMPPKH